MKKALLLYPEFSPFGFWNYKDVCRLMGAKYPASPLGMITMAALLPKDWQIKLIDMNTIQLDDAYIDWADLVFIGGMLPQQMNFLKLIKRVHARGKKVVAGGPAPTSQPEVYSDADYLVLGEAECSMNPFLEDLGKGVKSGLYRVNKFPNMTQSPVPRFDLLNFKDYIMIGVQFCRGCPYNCEFCDVIELFGRKTRAKTAEQIVKELETLYNLGYRGHVDFVDDNFIGHKNKAKQILASVKDWSDRHGHPFYYSTEASINLADDDELLSLMRDLDFRYVFIGIESADEEVLDSINKKQNVNRNIIHDLYKIYSYGIVVNGGFIIGFDDESKNSAKMMINTIEKGNICMSMIGLLYALPNTQLTRRLEKEKRLLKPRAGYNEKYDVDQATSGTNFITKRPLIQILEDYLNILQVVYSTRNYFNKCLCLSKLLNIKSKFKPNLSKIAQYTKAFFKIIFYLSFKPAIFLHFWRNLLLIMVTKISSVEAIVNIMAMYLHFKKQTQFINRLISKKLQALRQIGESNYIKKHFHT